jgi:prepilin-type N-terminal cleavage/methylation domain-containing protein
MKKRSNKGFTLVEVILSLAIFSIISVGFLGMFSSVYINTFKSTVVTENAFLAQRQIEDQIAVVKSDLEKNILPTGLTSTTVALFSGTNLRNVVVYHLTQSVTSDQVIDTLVAQSRPPQLQVPNITSTVTIASFSGTIQKDYPNIGMPNLRVELGTPLVVDNPGLLIRYLYYWYISNPGYYITNTPPLFPDNYEIIAEHTTNLIPLVPATYGGRFLKLVVTPVGEKGQMGSSVQSNALYISGIPINDNLIFNLDASYINVSDTTNQVRKVGADIFVKKWQDIGPTGISPVQATNNSQPVLLQSNVGTTELPQYVLGVEKFLPIVTGTTAWNVNTASPTSIINKANMTVYFAAMVDASMPVDTKIFESNAASTTGNRWTLSTDIATKKLVLTRYLASASTPFIAMSADATYADSTWRIFKLEILQNKLTISVDGMIVGTFTPTTATTTTMNLTDFRINFSEYFTISEIIVFDSIHDSTLTNSMYDYFNAKYNPQPTP